MGYKIGSGYFGSASLQTSTENQEIIQQHKPTGYNFFSAYKFSFSNVQACTIKINGSTDAIYLRANQGFSSEHYDLQISSFVIVESGIQYNYIGAY